MKKILMFGFRDLGEIMKIAAAAERCGAELQPVGRESCTLTLEALSQGKTGGASSVPIGKILRTGPGTGRPSGVAAAGGYRLSEGGADAE